MYLERLSKTGRKTLIFRSGGSDIKPNTIFVNVVVAIFRENRADGHQWYKKNAGSGMSFSWSSDSHLGYCQKGKRNNSWGVEGKPGKTSKEIM